MTIQVKLSQLRESVSREEEDKDRIDAQLATSSRVAQAIEESPNRLQTLCDKLSPKPTNTVCTQTESREIPVILRLTLLDSDNDD